MAREHVRGVLERCAWRINGPGGAAEILAVHPNTLRSRMKRLGLERPQASSIAR
jgi:transcriptional regulator with GAF, ATPase, and Fis domain